jgi:hypothetical protein
MKKKPMSDTKTHHQTDSGVEEKYNDEKNLVECQMGRGYEISYVYAPLAAAHIRRLRAALVTNEGRLRKSEAEVRRWRVLLRTSLPSVEYYALVPEGEE